MLLKKYFRLAGVLTVVLLFLLPIASAIEISVSYLLQVITDTASGHINMAYGVLVAVVVGYIFTDALVFFGSSFLEQVVLNKIVSKIRLNMIQSLLYEKTGLGYNTQNVSTEYYNDFTNTLDVLHSDYLQGSINAYKQLCQFVIAMILSVMIQPVFSLIIVLLCLPALIVPILQRRVLKDNKNQVLQASESYTHGLQNIINGIRTIQIFSIQSLMKMVFQKKNVDLLHSQNKDQLKRKQVGGISQLLDNVLYLGTWVVGIYFVMNKSVTLGQLVAFSQLMIFIAEPIQSASGLLGDIVGGKQAAIKIDRLTTKNGDGKASLKLNRFQDLQYEQVSFSDDGRQVLRDINLNLEADKHYVIVGKSGSGKSSLINVPFSSNTAIDGDVLINRRPFKEYKSMSLNQHIGILEQQSYVFDETIKNNLSLFDENIDDSSLMKILMIVV
ncbi:ABC transporter transmembrane domain-containing protein [Companilactobacillus hulinensis]|uniref:ABC transporter transmembrane domain-containing protein n=1 Tax=Companilactobacillus hulinensis TaxID=2486007 RepID=UPI000F78BD5A|nr:ABC transporter ATP-binding protein [Companilactobacillus hulinensis]